MLVSKARQGDKEALVALIMARKQDYYKLAYVYLKNQEDALDALEDMIVALYENIRNLKSADKFDSYSKTILVNCCKRLLGKRKKLIPAASVKEEQSDDVFRQKDQQLLIDKHLSQLKNKYQEALRLRYYLDLDYQAIAAITKVPVGTIKSRIFYGLKQLRERLGGEELD